MKHWIGYLIAVIGLAGTFQPARGAMSNWQELGGGKARLVAWQSPEDGAIHGTVEIDLKEGWKTYWRTPGDSGIPPIFDFSASRDAMIERTEFQVPEKITLPAVTFAGYKNAVSFPFFGRATGPQANIRLSLTIGLCEQICIPATAELSLPAGALNISDPAAQMKVTQAMMLLPVAALEGFGVTKAELAGVSRLIINAEVPADEGDPELFLEADWYLPAPKLISRNATIARFEIDIPGEIDLAAFKSAIIAYTLGAGIGGVEGVLPPVAPRTKDTRRSK